jgi:hypothetical protein
MLLMANGQILGMLNRRGRPVSLEGKGLLARVL